MTARPLSADLVGLSFEPASTSWTAKDTMLYAAGVGTRPDDELDFLYEGKGPKVLPTFAVIPGTTGMIGLVGAVDINPAMVLHGEQAVECHREIPPEASASSTGRIVEVWDKGQAAVVVVEVVTEDAGGPLFTNRSTIFVRGAGGFGGERGPSTSGRHAPPERAPDHVVAYETRPEQAAVYRLSGDVNPLHIDPDFAKMAGFERPFLHGLCTYGFVGRAVLHSLCGGDPARFGSLEGRFADQVYPGDTIVTKIWVTGDGEAVLQAENQDGAVVLSQAAARFHE